MTDAITSRTFTPADPTIDATTGGQASTSAKGVSSTNETMATDDVVPLVGGTGNNGQQSQVPQLPGLAMPLPAEEVGIAIMELQSKASALQMDSVKGMLDGVAKMQKGLNDQAIQSNLDASKKALSAEHHAHKKSIWGWISSIASTIASVVVAAVTLNPAAVVSAVMSVADLALQVAFACGAKFPSCFDPPPPTLNSMLCVGIGAIAKHFGASDTMARNIANGIVAGIGAFVAVTSGGVAGATALSTVTQNIAASASAVVVGCHGSQALADDIGIAVAITCTLVAAGMVMKGDPAKMVKQVEGEASTLSKIKDSIAKITQSPGFQKAAVATGLVSGATAAVGNVVAGSEGIAYASDTKDESNDTSAATDLQAKSSALNTTEKSLTDSIKDITSGLNAMLEKADEVIKNDSATRLQLANMDRPATA